MRKWIILAIACLLVVSVGVGIGISIAGTNSKAGQVTKQESAQGNNEQGNDTGEQSSQASNKVPDPEPKDLNALAKVTEDLARQAALNANPGTTVKSAGLENENGNLVWGVELSNGTDVKVDAGNGSVLKSEQAGQEDQQKEQGQEKTENGGEKPETNESQ
jgi:uncharacterized membrane protein YkoI